MAGLFVAVTVVGLVATLVGEHSSPLLRLLGKPIASAGFVGLALSLGASETTYGWWILAALGFGWVGDVALLGSDRSWFLIGLIAFLMGHLLYTVAFAVAGVALGVTAVAALVAASMAMVVYRWLRPHLPTEMVGPVVGYLVIISAMLATAVGATSAGATALILLGAAAFYLSDLSVARDRFVAPGFVNRIWGLPLYYLGQLLLAWSVA